MAANPLPLLSLVLSSLGRHPPYRRDDVIYGRPLYIYILNHINVIILIHSLWTVSLNRYRLFMLTETAFIGILIVCARVLNGAAASRRPRSCPSLEDVLERRDV